MGLKRFKITLNRPISFKSNTYTSKDGVYVFCEEKRNILGEISPLPEYSKLSVSDLMPGLEKLNPQKIIATQTSHNKFGLYETFVSLLEPLKINTPEVRFGLSMLVNQYFNNLPASDSTDSLKRTKTQGLLDASHEYNPEEISDIQKKTTVVKIKVGRADPSQELLFLEKILEQTNLKLRIDSNQKWRLSEAIDFFKNIPKDRIEYAEEPLKNPNELELFYSKTTIPYALDENIQSFRHKKLKGLAALIIKPTLVGSYFDIIELIREYRLANEKLEIILSSSFESDEGLKYIHCLAQHINPNAYHGLDTQKFIGAIQYVED